VHRLFPQVRQVLFHRLDFQLQLRQVLFQLLGLFCLGQELALKGLTFFTAITAALTTALFTITGFIVGHGISPLSFSDNEASKLHSFL
jgi:hypothetical protein